ncbi:undecaprenyl-diphosphate phosphatase [Mesoterricola silvestris]|uniref:Undecaprenyl-diphosphatase n=1 Tax=Mesoterricola silvestris TaxID=2927979 RepID=A0AA48GHC4_9BACT|nr:undecaprenyl-diphosphate phosphatase [Mesoterricola silvestris]BDU72881.1 undecaprenyl-diphosphatase [Mesoterricola silvestris]
MTLLIAILLGLIQGVTEFLPVSSTAHLTLAENLLLRQSMPLAFDVLLHVGTLLALIVYFRAEILQMLRGILGRDAEGLRLAGWVLLAMVPTVIFGFATRHLKETAKEHVWIYGACLLLTAVLLFTANNLSARNQEARGLDEMGPWDALAVGTIQGLGGGFGLSRSGSTIAMGVFKGLKLPSATRFSFLLGMPTILGAAVLEGSHILKPLLRHQPLPAELAFPAGSISPALACVVGVAVSAVSGYFAIGLLDRFTRKPRLNPFAFYCLCAGVAMIILGTVGAKGFFFAQGVSLP